MRYTISYKHDRDTPGHVSCEVTVEAPNEEVAIMRAGMARAESLVGRMSQQFYRPYRLTWKRISIKEAS